MNITIKDFGLAVLLIFVGFSAGFPLGTSLERSYSRQKAIDAGIGLYVVDDKTGNVDFIFLKPEKPEAPEIYEQKAIKAGAAEYRINPRTGERTFNFFAQQQATPVAPSSPTVEKLKVLPRLEKKDAGAAGISVVVPQ